MLHFAVCSTHGCTHRYVAHGWFFYTPRSRYRLRFVAVYAYRLPTHAPHLVTRVHTTVRSGSRTLPPFYGYRYVPLVRFTVLPLRLVTGCRSLCRSHYRTVTFTTVAYTVYVYRWVGLLRGLRLVPHTVGFRIHYTRSVPTHVYIRSLYTTLQLPAVLVGSDVGFYTPVTFVRLPVSSPVTGYRVAPRLRSTHTTRRCTFGSCHFTGCHCPRLQCSSIRFPYGLPVTTHLPFTLPFACYRVPTYRRTRLPTIARTRLPHCRYAFAMRSLPAFTARGYRTCRLVLWLRLVYTFAHRLPRTYAVRFCTLRGLVRYGSLPRLVVATVLLHRSPTLLITTARLPTFAFTWFYTTRAVLRGLDSTYPLDGLHYVAILRHLWLCPLLVPV